MRSIRCVMAAAMLICASPALGQQVTAKEPQSVVRALQDAGFQAKLEKDSQGDPMIKSASSGSKFTVLFFNCTGNKDCATVQFYTAYDTEGPKLPTLDKINEWNRSQRFGRAYLDKEGDPTIEMDVDLDDGGMSKELFTDNLEFWTAVMSGFEKHIGW